MDVISVISSVVAVTEICLKTTQTLNDLRSRYKNTDCIIASLSSECTVMGASLLQVQKILLNSHFRDQPELRAVFETSLTGCASVFTLLDHEMDRISHSGPAKFSRSWKSKVKFLWNEERMKEYLSQIRGQQNTLALLIQLLQMYVYCFSNSTSSL